MRLAIVGSTSVPDWEVALRIIREAIERLRPTDELEEFVIVSGGAEGVDTLAEREAGRQGIPTAIFRPSRNGWRGPGGYKERNLKIADYCTYLIRIVRSDTETYGSGWTRDQARRQGKPTEEFVLQSPQRDP